MRLALLSCSALTLATLFACSTFSDANDEAPPPTPPVEAGADTGPIDECTPADPSAPPSCSADLMTDPLNCGACGHACIDVPCAGGLCESTRVTDAVPIVAIDGTTAYVPVGQDIYSADLAKGPYPVKFAQFFPNVSGTTNFLEVHAGDLYIGSSSDQVIVNLESKTPRKNADFALTKVTRYDGHFLPGPVSYYDYPSDTGGEELARIKNGDVDFKPKKSSYAPLGMNAAGELFWTTGGKVFGPWERDQEPIVAVGTTTLEAVIGEGDTVFLATGGSGGKLTRTTRGGAALTLAKEEGVGVALAIDGDDLFYAVRRTISGALDRHYLFRIDKCRGGTPVPLLDVNVAIKRIYLTEKTHVIVNTDAGLYRVRR